MHTAIPAMTGSDCDESHWNRKDRRERIRLFVRFLVDEYKLLKAMGMDDAISLYRISMALWWMNTNSAKPWAWMTPLVSIAFPWRVPRWTLPRRVNEQPMARNWPNRPAARPC